MNEINGVLTRMKTNDFELTNFAYENANDNEKDWELTIDTNKSIIKYEYDGNKNTNLPLPQKLLYIQRGILFFSSFGMSDDEVNKKSIAVLKKERKKIVKKLLNRKDKMSDNEVELFIYEIEEQLRRQRLTKNNIAM